MENTQTNEYDPSSKIHRDLVWLRHQGKNNSGYCYCCWKKIYMNDSGWCCTYVVCIEKGGVDDDVDNLRTCCIECNSNIGNQNLYAYMLHNKMRGPGTRNIRGYFELYPYKRNDKRTNDVITNP